MLGVGFSHHRIAFRRASESVALPPWDGEGFMLTADECKNCSADCKSRAKEPGVSKERAAVLMNISMTWTILAGQLERLAGIMKREAE